MEIRLAVPDDLREIDKFDVFAGKRIDEIKRNEIWVSVQDGTVSGYITFNHSFYLKPFIQFLNVRKEFRRKGIADRLINYIENNCTGKKIFISTETDNLAMIRLLEKRKYRIAGIIEELQEQGEIVFCKDLTD